MFDIGRVANLPLLTIIDDVYPSVHLLPHDLGDGTLDASVEDGARSIVDAGVRAFGRVDTLVNNAGDGGPTKPVQDYTVDDWFYTVNSCLTSAYLCSRFAVPAMITAGRGAIVNIASMAGRRGLAYRVGYCSAKAGQIGMTYGLALELGRHNITVNAIAPGAVAGDRIDRVIKGQAEVRGVEIERMRESFVERSPLRRMSTPEDISSLAAFLCSDLARNISGQCIPFRLCAFCLEFLPSRLSALLPC